MPALAAGRGAEAELTAATAAAANTGRCWGRRISRGCCRSHGVEASNAINLVDDVVSHRVIRHEGCNVGGVTTMEEAEGSMPPMFGITTIEVAVGSPDICASP
eukprot:CAMPEP_0115277906 /NCGR_PEP_ID=MMETSP0270-20121206/57483_1 /TAXON_ID=71861 /ORGANISM="Scrippsiella trochoidea, Strain CCMP3099" /LENGTH=102 /DNA_ID=CAMNT_0002694565 /DNA_START=28 /DNA_END=337 /DNA_ORIENTATION=-